MKGFEIRQKFLAFFEKHGHQIVESSSLVPRNDPTLLFTNAGMNQFKDLFLGVETRSYQRATTSQKCVRAGGKHNDLENVGFTARHHTFFEMLGNFSFGDYFKEDAIRFAWQFITKELKLPKNKLYVTVFKTDDDAAKIWHEQEKVPKERIFRFDEKDNFWQMGDTGPCGPCSEIFIDRGEKAGCRKKTCKVGCDCDRYMEIWNLVFMQYNRDKSGKLNPLPKPSIDTGSGLERLASVLQNAESNYDTDIFQDIIQKISTLARKKIQKSNKASFQVIADHARATSFLISDGVMPSNEGRGYVLRRIMRRAIRHGKSLGFSKPFFFEICSFVVDQMNVAYPELKDKKEFIRKAVKAEEEQFLKTLERGLGLLNEEMTTLGKRKILSGKVAFKLYDTYGFPLDLTRVICSENGLAVDETGFEEAMSHQKEESKKHWKGSGEEAIDSVYLSISEQLEKEGKLPTFIGYDALTAESECISIIKTEKGITQAVFRETPFYGESGGQVGDRGEIVGKNFSGKVVDSQKPVPTMIVLFIKPDIGELKVGAKYTQKVSSEIRSLTARNHTGTHLLHWALREVLGKHVKQAGSLVTPELLRFDITHFQPMTPDEIQKVEDLVNEKIWSSDKVKKKEMDKDEAIGAGAIAFFGEKYGEKVRVVSLGDYSVELCGGTHVDQVSDIHLFRIVSEGGIAAGVRRIVATTSKGAFSQLRASDQNLRKVKEMLKAAKNDEIVGRLDKVFANEKELRRKIEKLESLSAGSEVDTLIQQAKPLKNGKLISAVCKSDAKGIKHLRDLSDRILQKSKDSLVILGMSDPGNKKAFLLVSAGPKASTEHNANKILQKLAHHIEGRGGGKADLAQAGGNKPSGLVKAIEEAKNTIE